MVLRWYCLWVRFSCCEVVCLVVVWVVSVCVLYCSVCSVLVMFWKVVSMVCC